jgi:hypothetical protein
VLQHTHKQYKAQGQGVTLKATSYMVTSQALQENYVENELQNLNTQQK